MYVVYARTNISKIIISRTETNDKDVANLTTDFYRSLGYEVVVQFPITSPTSGGSNKIFAAS